MEVFFRSSRSAGGDGAGEWLWDSGGGAPVLRDVKMVETPWLRVPKGNSAWEFSLMEATPTPTALESVYSREGGLPNQGLEKYA
jgi:hypothetical protein